MPKASADLEGVDLACLRKMAHHPPRPIESLGNDVDTKGPLATLML